VKTVIAGRTPAGRGVRIHHGGGRITAVEPDPHAPDRWLLPGLLDLQVNGYAGLDVNDPQLSTSTIHELVRAESRCGVTGFCPTVVTADEEGITHALAVIAAARAEDDWTRHAVLGVHVEGPYLSADDGPRGAHDAAQLRPPSIEEFRRWQAAAGNAVRIVTLAPELPAALDYIRHISAHGVVAAVGHTSASPEQIRAAADAGARMSTHLGNGAHALLPRHPNYIWAQLAESRLTASFVADGLHLPLDTFVAMLRAKGRHHRILVSDSTALAGALPGEYRTPVGGDVTLRADGRLVLAGSELLAGSTSSLRDCLAWTTQHAGLSLRTATAMATSVPASLLGLTDRGNLRPGQWADLTVLSPDLTVEQTVVRGDTIFENSAG
jgi:N-acetylglucosamine-6-phosphate deacetylase